MCGDHCRLRLGAHFALVALLNCFRTRSLFYDLLPAAALLSCFVGLGIDDLRAKSLGPSLDGVGGLIDL